MKEKIEKYIRAILKSEEAKFKRIIFGYTCGILIVSTIIGLTFSITPWHPIVTAVIWCAILSSTWAVVDKKLKQQQQVAMENLEKLHPIDGDEGAVKTLQQKVADFFTTTLGTKFTGVKHMPDERTNS